MDKISAIFKIMLSVFVINLALGCDVLIKPANPVTPDSGTETSESISTATGTIQGTAFYSNSEDFSGIHVILQRTDGLRVVSTENQSSRAVSVSANNSFTCVTDESGDYKFSDVPVGLYTIYASFSSTTEKAVLTNVSVLKDSVVTADTLKLTKTGSLSGKIILDGTDTGNYGFTVFLGGTSFLCKTNKAGEFCIEDIPSGKTYELFIEKGLFTFYYGEVTVNAGSNLVIKTQNFTSEEINPAVSGTKGDKGDKGDTGASGKDGVSIVWRGAFASATEIEELALMNAYFNTTDGCSYIYTADGWTLLASKGADGQNGTPGAGGTPGADGKDGISIVWLGAFASATGIEEPALMNAYFNTTDGCSYIYTADGWTLLASKGDKGDTGETGKFASCIVNYELNGGTAGENAPAAVTYGNSITLVNPLSRTGYTFKGWYTSSTFTGSPVTTFTFDGNTPSVTFYAKWTVNQYSITYKDRDNETFSGVHGINYPTKHIYGTETLLVTPTKQNFIFKGWYTTSDCSTPAVTKLTATGYTDNITLYAKWGSNTYNITYKNEGDTSFSGTHEEGYPTTHTYGDPTVLDVPTLDGYLFAGWYLASDCSGTAVTKLGASTYNDDITLYAKWVGKTIESSNFASMAASLVPSSTPYEIKISDASPDISSIKNAMNSISSQKEISFVLDLSSCSSLTLGGSAFSRCNRLAGIKLPSTITSLPDYAFSNSGLKSIEIPESVTVIGEYAFNYCKELTSVSLSSGIQEIGPSAFYHCESLTSVSIPNTVTVIKSRAFGYCESLTSLTIPVSVTEIPDDYGNIVMGCKNLETLVVEAGNTKYDSRNNCNAIIKTSTDTLISGTKNTTIPGTVREIEGRAFSDIKSLESISIPSSVTSIGHYAFENTGLKSFVLPASVTYISDAILMNCSDLESISVEEGNTKYDSRNNCNAIVGKEDNCIYAGCINTTFPDSIVSIGHYGFSGCRFTTITIPSSIERIGSSAFDNCNELVEVTIGSKEIGDNAFYYLPKLTKVTLENTVERLGSSFNGCKEITEVVIPSSVKVIDDYAFGHFYYDTKLKLIFEDTSNWYRYTGSDSWSSWVNDCTEGNIEPIDVSDPAAIGKTLSYLNSDYQLIKIVK